MCVLPYLLCLTADRPFLAHRDAYQFCGILHCDISANNILLTECPTFAGGLLIDWDLCKKVESGDPSAGSARQSTRTVCSSYSLPDTLLEQKIDLQGTWQFMAANLIEDPMIGQTFHHDLESAFFVLLWMAILYLESSWGDDYLSNFVTLIFHPQVFGNSGGLTKLMFMQSEEQPKELEIRNNTPLIALLHGLKELLSVRHRKQPEKTPPTQKLDVKDLIQRTLQVDAQGAELTSTLATSNEPSQEKDFQKELDDYNTRMLGLRNHDAFILIIDDALDKSKYTWPADDHAQRRNLVLSRTEKSSLRSSSKRCREAAAASEGNAPPKQYRNKSV